MYIVWQGMLNFLYMYESKQTPDIEVSHNRTMHFKMKWVLSCLFHTFFTIRWNVSCDFFFFYWNLKTQIKTPFWVNITIPWGDMSRLTFSKTSKNNSLRRYLMPSLLQPIWPVTWFVICDCSSFVCNNNNITKWHTSHHKTIHLDQV